MSFDVKITVPLFTVIGRLLTGIIFKELLLRFTVPFKSLFFMFILKSKSPSISLKNASISLPLLMIMFESTISITSLTLNFLEERFTFKPFFLDASAFICTFDLFISRTQSFTKRVLSFITTLFLSAIAKCRILSPFFIFVSISKCTNFSTFWVLSIFKLSALSFTKTSGSSL